MVVFWVEFLEGCRIKVLSFLLVVGWRSHSVPCHMSLLNITAYFLKASQSRRHEREGSGETATVAHNHGNDILHFWCILFIRTSSRPAFSLKGRQLYKCVNIKIFLKFYFSITVYISYYFVIVSGVQHVRQSYTLQSVPPDISSTHLAPYIVITI